MKKHNDQPIHEVLAGIMKNGPLKAGYYDAKVKRIWEDKLGKLLMHQTEKIHFDKQVIYIKLSSAPLRQQLMMGKEQLIKNFNLELEENIVNDIIFK